MRNGYGSWATYPDTFVCRALPLAVLQSLIMWLQSLQSFPEHRLLHLRCHTGYSTSVVWCHYVLGLTVSVSLEGSEVTFGRGTSNVLIEESDSVHAGASLMDPADPHEPLFTLVSDESIPISYESRAQAYGFGTTMLENAEIPDDERQYCSHWIIACALLGISEDPSYRSGMSTQPHTMEDTLHNLPFETRDPSQERIIQAGRFLFALDNLDYELIGSCNHSPPQMAPSGNHVNWACLVIILETFSRIRKEDLHRCTALPLSLRGYETLQKAEHVTGKISPDNISTRSWNLVGSFENLYRLLLGHMYSEDYVKNAVLVSAWGWSIFFESIDAIDPADVSTDTIRVMHGVPTRRGLRRSRIIDGPARNWVMSNGTVEALGKDLDINYFLGVGNTTKERILVGHHADAFQITQIFNWVFMNQTDKQFMLGFRKMQELCVRAERLAPCQHPSGDVINSVVVDTWIDKLGNGSRNGDTALLKNAIDEPTKSKYEIKWPKDEKSRNDWNERVVVRHDTKIPRNPSKLSMTHSPDSPSLTDVCYFYVSDNPNTRWLQLNNFYNRANGAVLSLVLRGQRTCVACAMKNNMERRTKPTLVLL